MAVRHHQRQEFEVAVGDVLHAPRAFPEYGPDCYATYFLDPHGFKLEVVCHEPPGDATA